MNSCWITIRTGRSDIPDSEIADDARQAWLQDKLEYATSRLGGNRAIRVDRVDPLGMDVGPNFTVTDSFVADVRERFRGDFRALRAIMQGVEIAETKNDKLGFPRINGEQFPVVVGIDPDSGRPIYTED